ncbi:MAG: hypothetical protein ACSHX4_11800 [Opitutaceae bacterium]
MILMNPKCLLSLLFAFLVSIICSHALESRTWTSVADGRTISGAFVATKGTQIVIQRDGGGEISLSPDLLVQADRDYIFNHLPNVESPIRLEENAVKTEIVWKVGDSKSWRDAYTYYEYGDEGCYISEDEKWVFLYKRLKNEGTLLKPGITFNNGMRDPFDSSISRVSKFDLHREKSKEVMESCLVESKLSHSGGFVCRYYKYASPSWEMEVWSVPVKHPLFNPTLDVSMDEIIRKPGYDMLRRDGKHASYERRGIDAQDLPLNVYTKCGLVPTFAAMQTDYPIIIKHVYKEPKRKNNLAELDMLMTNRLIPSTSDSSKFKVASTKEMLEAEIHGEVIVGKPGSGWTFK